LRFNYNYFNCNF